MTNKEAIQELKCYHREDGTVPEEITLAIKALMVYRDCKHCTHNIKIGNMRGCALWDCDFEDIRGGDNT